MSTCTRCVIRAAELLDADGYAVCRRCRLRAPGVELWLRSEKERRESEAIELAKRAPPPNRRGGRRRQ